MKKTVKCGCVVGVSAALMFGVCGVVGADYKDVPKSHWSYEAVKFLASEGIVTGYGDNTFRGDRTMSRYEMAAIVQKTLENNPKTDIAQQALLDKLAKEYALEMNGIETRLAEAEKKQSRLQFSGRINVQYRVRTGYDPDNDVDNSARLRLAARFGATLRVDENTSMGMRFNSHTPNADKYAGSSNTNAGDYRYSGLKLDRAFAKTKLGPNTTVTIGRQEVNIDDNEVIIDSVFPQDGIRLDHTWNNLNFSYQNGQLVRSTLDKGTNGVGSSFGIGVRNRGNFAHVKLEVIKVSQETDKFSWDMGWASFKNNTKTTDAVYSPTLTNTFDPAYKDLMTYYFVGGNYLLNNKLSVFAEYGKNTDADKPNTSSARRPSGWSPYPNPDGTFKMIGLTFGDQKLRARGHQNITVSYLKAGTNSINGIFTSFDAITEDENDGANGHAYDSFSIAWRYAFSRNMQAGISFGTVKDKNIGWKSSYPDASYKVWKVYTRYNF